MANARASEERPFRLRPPRRRGRRADELRVYSRAFKRLIHIVRMSSRRSSSGGGGTRRTYNQRCAVRVTYSGNRVPGQWRAHGRYLSREAATRAGSGSKLGFGSSSEPINVAATLDRWQAAGDERIFKIIVSPEFGERLDLMAHTRSLVAQMERDLGTTLEWAAVCHYNTGHPHVHITIRGVNDRGEPLRLERDYIRFGIRQHAENLCTSQIGYRTQLDADEAQRREVEQQRYTSLDRLIKRKGANLENDAAAPFYFPVTLIPDDPTASELVRAQLQHTAARLIVLHKMGLAEPFGPGSWQVRSDFEQVLRAIQQAGDRQKTLAAYGALLSDQRLPLQVTSPANITKLEGRVLGHGQEDSTGRPYVLIEGTDGKVHFIYQNVNIESARHRGRMRVNSFVQLRRNSSNARRRLMVEDLGDAEALLANKRFIRRRAQYVVQAGLLLRDEPCWGGWLGRYQAQLRDDVRTLTDKTQQQNRRPSVPHGR